MERAGFYAPRFENLPMLYCARYAVMVARHLSGANYSLGNAWNLGERNKILKNLTRDENLEDCVELLEEGKSIVIFFNPLSTYNKDKRKGTHAAVYLGKRRYLFFAEQYFFKQRIKNLREMKKLWLKPVQIISPLK
jgi:hypothetical protein